ncbi:MAG TPA: flagellar export chaperone FliS [Candidatus Sulfopaludibacter sp.]|nr:flagellar export chaperone FliS [Candidatus Sulfopaludibacter sp.]
MRKTNPWNSYRQVTMLTAPPGQIILMLFDGGLHALEVALSGFSMADPAQVNMTIHNNLQRAREIIAGLNGALNMEQGGEFARTMRRLYGYFERRLLESNLRKTRDGIEEVIRHLTVLREAWAAMLNNQTPSGQFASQPAALATV